MKTPKFDRPLLRLVALALSAIALFGWDWSFSYRVGAIDTWELPILSSLLFISALIPFQMRARVKAIAYMLALIAVFTFAWWILERAKMAIGGFDFGGIIVRLIAYGIVLVLLLSTSKPTSTSNVESPHT